MTEDILKSILITILGICMLVAGTVLLIGWNNSRNSARGRGDAAVGTVNSDPRIIYQMPDRFKNIAVVCDKYGNAIYSTTSDGGSASMYAVKDGCK